MRTTCWLVIAVGLAGWTVGASPLAKGQVAGDAKWVLHLDCERFMGGKVGGYLVVHVLEPRSAELRAKLKEELGVELDWKKIKSITAYGTGYRPQEDDTGVVMIRTTLDVAAVLDAAAAKGLPQLRIAKEERSGSPVYRVNDQAVLAKFPGDLVVIARNERGLERAGEVLGGKIENLESAKAFQEYPEVSYGFFLLAVAEGFGEQAGLPARAAIFKQAKGARVVLGEEGDRVRLNFDLKSETAESCRQIQQVAQGLLALATMNAEQNPDLKKLTQATAVTSSGKCVTLAVSLPVADVLAKIEENHSSD